VHPEVRERAREKTRFTISELSLYLGCPRAWEVTYGLRVARGEDPSAQRGRIAHRMLEAAFADPGLPAATRLERAEAALAADETARGIDPPGRAVLAAQVARVIAAYSPPAWPFRPLAVETDLELAYRPLGATIVGRTDRVDEMSDGALVLVDYKSGRRPRWRYPAELGRDLQACLYPAMVAHHLGREVLGAIFISIRHEGHDGLVRRLAPGLDAPTLHEASDLLAGLAKRNLTRAVEGIRAGRFDGEAPGCRTGCPCRTLRLGSPAR
jgi:RecB family exonuclease